MRTIFNVAVIASISLASDVLERVHHLSHGLDLMNPHGHAPVGDVWEHHQEPEHVFTA